MTELLVSDLHGGVEGREILHGVDLAVRSGEVHAVMGPNGSGKSTLAHLVMGHPGFEILGGSVTLDGADLLGLPTWQRARAGVFLGMQYPIEVPGVPLEQALAEALRDGNGRAGGDGLHERLAAEARRIGLDERLLERPLNVDLSGGERKRNETLQLMVLRPRIAILDEIDSGLDIDALKAVSQRIEQETQESGLGVVVITHYTRVLHELKPDVVHVLSRGRIVDTGGPELADRLEQTGYEAYRTTADEAEATGAGNRPLIDDPFADPLA